MAITNRRLAYTVGASFALLGASCSSGGSQTGVGGSVGSGGTEVGTGGTGTPGTGGSGDGGGVGSGGSGQGGGSGAGTGGLTGTGGHGTGGGSVVGPTGDPLIDKFVCPNQTGGPTPEAAVPSITQQSYQHAELTAYIHFGLDTFDGTEQGNTSDTPAVFNPTNLTQATVDHWVSTLQGAGFQQAQLTTKHSTGFCLWPTQSTNYSVANSPWMGGKGDLVKMFTDSMKKAGMRAALYLAPWDQHAPSGSPSYTQVFKTQFTELMSNYGTVYETTFDGFNSPGSNGTPATVNWADTFRLGRMLQSHLLVWAGPEVVQLATTGNPPAIADLQWIGNENGQASRTTSSLNVNNCAKTAGGTTVGTNDWCPWESNVSSHMPQWFWHPGQAPISVAQLENIYFQTVGMNSTLLLNIPPDQTGDFDPKDVALLQGFGTWYHSTFQTDVLKNVPAMGDSTWASAGFEAAKAVDDDVCTYWAAASGKTTGTLQVTPAAPITINVISIREPIQMGERVTKYHVEINQNGTWTTASDTHGVMVAGTVIGNRQLWQLNKVTATGVRLVVDSARDVPLIAEFAVY